jgi:protein SCO1/2
LEKLIGPPGFTGNAPGGPSRWSTERSAKWQPLKPKLVSEVRYDHFTGERSSCAGARTSARSGAPWSRSHKRSGSGQAFALSEPTDLAERNDPAAGAFHAPQGSEDSFMNAAVMRLALPLVGFLMLTGAARGSLLASAIDAVGVTPPPDARAPTALEFIDEDGVPRTLADVMAGRPTLLILADYTCKSLCGPILGLAAHALGQSALQPGTDYRVVAIGLDPDDQPSDARAMKRAQIGEGSGLASATAFLTAEADALEQIEASLGYRSAYDSQNDQVAHPAVAFVLTGDGRLARVLSGLALDPADLRQALVEAGEGRIGNLVDTVRLICYGFDPAAGVYTLSIHRLLLLLSLLSIAALAAAVGLMLREETRQKA